MALSFTLSQTVVEQRHLSRQQIQLKTDKNGCNRGHRNETVGGAGSDERAGLTRVVPLDDLSHAHRERVYALQWQKWN